MPCTGEVLSFGESGTSSTLTDGSSLCNNRNNNNYVELHTELRQSCNVAPVPNSSMAGTTACSNFTPAITTAASPQPELQSSRVRSPSSRSTVVNPQMLFNALHPLPGEEFDNDNWVDMCYCRLFLTQYRIIIVTHNHNAACAIPLINVESVEAKDIVGLHIICKDGRIIRIQAGSSEVAITWFKKLTQIICGARNLKDVFAFKFFNSFSQIMKEKAIPSTWILRKEENLNGNISEKNPSYENLVKEFEHLELRDSCWRITSANENFALSPTYPQHLIVPTCVTDEELLNIRTGRYYGRFPTLAWRCPRRGAVLLRSSQPCIGFFGMANEFDVKHYEKIRSATLPSVSLAGATKTADKPASSSKFLIMDARSYTAAWANRAKDTYTDAEVAFMGLPNIHSIKYSFHQLRQLLNSVCDQNTFFQSLQSTIWLQNIGHLFSAAERCFNAMHFEGTSVLVHCSDGWDRTTQIVSLCMLIGDPFYRTFEGFELLVQRQWIEFGHKFADRSGVLNGDENERSPVFLQFLDCVYQLWMKNQDAFEFNKRYLSKLAQHTYSGLFSSFLFNSIKDAVKVLSCSKSNNQTAQKTDELRAFSIWDYLGKQNHVFVNPAYDARRKQSTLDFPKQMSEFELWRDCYCLTRDQARVNNPEEGVLPATSSVLTSPSGSHEPSSLEKVTTLSRSQSASSLTSLEQNAHAIQPLHSTSTHLNGGIYAPTSNSNHSSYGVVTRYNETTGTNSTASNPLSGLQYQNFLDVDGLSKVPMVFEDRVVEIFRQLELQVQNMSAAAGSAHHERLLNGKAHSHIINNNSNNLPTTNRRVRNESIDSTSFGFEVIDEFDPCCKRKHDSSGNSSSCSTFTTLGECPPTNGCNGCKNQIRTSIPSMTALSTTTTTNGGGQHMQQDKKVAVLQLGSVEDVRCSGGGNGQLVIG
uniref:Myotubularin phosphatase domain-containing protein n=1 Tax=Ditylenchus dipsaci TaxID=166011 RepID=A0A915DG96_9BILA